MGNCEITSAGKQELLLLGVRQSTPSLVQGFKAIE